MSRGPLDVLREVASFMAQAYPSFSTADEMREAIAQVEALVEASRSADQLLGDLLPGDVAGSMSVYVAINQALAPFTPGQDSEGGGHG